MSTLSRGVRSRPPTAGAHGHRQGLVASLVGTAVEWYDFFLYGSAAALVFGTLFFPSRPAGRHAPGLRHVRAGVRRPPARRHRLRALRRPVGRKRARRHPAADGRRHRRHRPAADLRQIGVAAPILLRLPARPGLRGRRRVGRRRPDGRRARRRRRRGSGRAGRRPACPRQPARHAVLAPRWRPTRHSCLGLAHPVPAVGGLVLIGLWVRLSLEDSPVFAEAKAEIEARDTRLPILEVIRRYPGVLRHGHADGREHLVLPLHDCHHLRHDLPRGPRSAVLGALSSARGCSSSVIPLLGAVSDQVAAVRSTSWVRSASASGASCSSRSSTPSRASILLAVLVGLFFHALMYAPQAAFFSELFGTSVRYTGASVGYQWPRSSRVPSPRSSAICWAVARTRSPWACTGHRLGHHHRLGPSPRRPGRPRSPRPFLGATRPAPPLPHGQSHTSGGRSPGVPAVEWPPPET